MDGSIQKVNCCILWIDIMPARFRKPLECFYKEASCKVKTLWEGHKNRKNLPLVLTKQLFLIGSIKTNGIFFQIFASFPEKLNFTIFVRKSNECSPSKRFFSTNHILGSYVAWSHNKKKSCSDLFIKKLWKSLAVPMCQKYCLIAL